MPPFRIKQ